MMSKSTSDQPVARSTDDLEMCRRAQQRLVRQLWLNQSSLAVGLLLGAAALAVGCGTSQAWARWPLLFAAALEIGFVPWHTITASRRLRRMLAVPKRGRFDEHDGLSHDLQSPPYLARPSAWVADAGKLDRRASVQYCFQTNRQTGASGFFNQRKQTLWAALSQDATVEAKWPPE